MVMNALYSGLELTD